MGAHSALLGLLAELWLQRAPASPRFLANDISMESPPRPRSFGFAAGVRFNYQASRLSFAPSGRAAGSACEAQGEPGLGRRRPGALACARRAPRPAPRRGSGAPRLSVTGPGSPRGDGAPERALFAVLATLRTSFHPPASSHPKPPLRPCLFFLPRVLHRGTQGSAWGGVSGASPWSQAGPGTIALPEAE